MAKMVEIVVVRGGQVLVGVEYPFGTLVLPTCSDMDDASVVLRRDAGIASVRATMRWLRAGAQGMRFLAVRETMGGSTWLDSADAATAMWARPADVVEQFYGYDWSDRAEVALRVRAVVEACTE